MKEKQENISEKKDEKVKKDEKNKENEKNKEDKKNKKDESDKVTLGQAFKSSFYMLGLAFKACPGRVIGQFATRACEQLRGIFFNFIFWEFILGFIEREAPFYEAILFLIFSAIFLFVTHVEIFWFMDVVSPVGNQKMYENLHIRMYEKAADVELECFENPEFYNKYMKAANQIKGRAFSVLTHFSGLIGSLCALVYIFYKTIRIDPFAILFAVFSLLSSYFIGKKINQVNYELYQKNISEDRKKEYVKRTIYQQDYAKELRMSNGFFLMMYYFGDAVDAVIQNTKEYGLKAGILTCCSESCRQVFITAGAILYASLRLLYFKNLSISGYILLINAISSISGHFADDAECLRKVQDNHLYIQNIKEFFDYEPKLAQSQDGKPVDREELLLEMEHVSFSYFGQEKEVLKDISLSIRKKEKIVLVGENGAGKSTLVKLLMRLYDPTEGCLLLNRTDVREYKVQEYRDLFGTVFQDYKVLSLTAAENVLMRRMREEDRPVVEEALKNSGVYDKVMSLPYGMDTVLTKEFDPEGSVLSGGEYQKIAIARMFARDCEIAILDEPSSALDPIAEYQMYESMLKACKNKAVVFISHRLSSAVLADKIYMLEHGRIIEQGSHEELMKKNGKYAEMFRFQAENYVGEVS